MLGTAKINGEARQIYNTDANLSRACHPSQSRVPQFHPTRTGLHVLGEALARIVVLPVIPSVCCAIVSVDFRPLYVLELPFTTDFKCNLRLDGVVYGPVVFVIAGMYRHCRLWFSAVFLFLLGLRWRWIPFYHGPLFFKKIRMWKAAIRRWRFLIMEF